MKTIKIYTLQHPDTNEIRYVGKTIQTLNQRLTNHISDAKAKRYKNHNINWIINLLNQDKLPKIQLLDEIEETDDYEWLEIYWIAQFRVWGYRLTNLTDGGDGNKNQKFSIESQLKKSKTIKDKVKLGLIDYSKRSLKISKALKGIKRSEETKEKVRQANLGKKCKRETKLKKAKAVLQYDLEGNFIKEWDILSEASQILNISKGAISNVCKSRQKTAGGFKWKYKNEDIV